MLFITVPPAAPGLLHHPLSTSALLSPLHLLPVCPSLTVTPNPFIFPIIYIKRIKFLLNFSPLFQRLDVPQIIFFFFFCSLVNCISLKKTFFSLLTWNRICCFWLFFFFLNLHISVFHFLTSSVPLAWTHFWAPVAVYPDQILVGSMPCRWAAILFDVFAIMPAQNLIPLFFPPLSFKFGLLKKNPNNDCIPYHSWFSLQPGNNAYFSPLFSCYWQITDCCAFPGLKLFFFFFLLVFLLCSLMSILKLLIYFFPLYTPEVLSDLSSFLYNCVHILDLVIPYFLYKNMGIAKSENKQWFIKPTSLSKRAEKAHRISRQE